MKEYQDLTTRIPTGYEGVTVIQPPNLGWLEINLGQNIKEYLWNCIENKGDSKNSDLAGHINNSYVLEDKNNQFFNETLQPLTEIYSDKISNLGSNVPTNNAHPYFLNSWWVNYQKAGDFNPIHKHGGVFSFVIWMQIPTHSAEQNKIDIGQNRNGNVISDFEISYVDMEGRIQGHVYKMTPDREGTMLLFPSWMKHQVYPFYNCDENRISISGNIHVDTSVIIPKDQIQSEPNEIVTNQINSQALNPLPHDPTIKTDFVNLNKRWKSDNDSPLTIKIGDDKPVATQKTQGAQPGLARDESVRNMIDAYEYPFWARDNDKIIEYITNAPPFAMSPRECHAHMTEWDLHVKCKEVGDLFNWVKYTLIPDHYGEKPTNAEIWGVRYSKGESLDWHNHRTSRYSFAYYANCPEGSSPLMFKENNVSIPPEEGKIIIFDGRLIHKVPPNDCDNRVIVSGNIFFN